MIKSGLAGTPRSSASAGAVRRFGKEKAAIIFEGNWIYRSWLSSFPNVKYRVYPMVRNKQRGTSASPSPTR